MLLHRTRRRGLRSWCRLHRSGAALPRRRGCWVLCPTLSRRNRWAGLVKSALRQSDGCVALYDLHWILMIFALARGFGVKQLGQ